MKNSIKISNNLISEGNAYVIAEIGNNHNGDLSKALKMIDLAKEMGAHSAKFQMRQLEEVYRSKSLSHTGDDLGTEYVLDLLKRFELTPDEHFKLFEHCQDVEIEYLCTPWDLKSAEILESFNVKAYKVASADLTNMPLVDFLGNTKKPLILSTGMSLKSEVEKTVEFLNNKHSEFILLHCNSTYPAPIHDINLRWIAELKKIHPMIGYSGHERGINISLAAIALGVCLIERHFTLDRTMEGPDHAASLEFDEFRSLILGIKEIELGLGSGSERTLSQGEMINRENLGKSLIASRKLSKGKIIEANDIEIKSPGQGLSPQFYDSLIGRKLSRDLEAQDFFFRSDLGDSYVYPRKYKCSRPWGVPVRFHDFDAYNKMISPDLWEFHLSYSDMDLDPKSFILGTFDQDFVVHAPELFAGSHLMDLATPDEEYRQESLKQTQRVVDLTRDLKHFFPNTIRPLIVANIGGFTMDEVLQKEDISIRYEIFGKSLSELDLDGVEIIPQTMAPFPWHFGGQRYQNLFVKPEEITYWCDQLGLRMCFDISHSKLTSNFFEIDYSKFVKQVAPYTAHLHLGDASGLNGEGLQIGDGEIDFIKLGKQLKIDCPNASFIPEIWQGHKNSGEGFWIAMEKLENII
jgi:sialic acid synthase SpsE/sugar phosphate isomerase/epimerase